MTTRIVHLSDLHFPARNSAQPDALARSIVAARPDLIVQTGDLTRSGRDGEFAAAADFLKKLPSRLLVVPGNHDIPVPGIWDRLVRPFARFAQYFPEQPQILETPDVCVVGLNTAVGLQWGPDWSLGRAVPARVRVAAARLRAVRGDRLGIVAAHHPLRRHALDLQRSRTAGGREAFETLAAAGMDVLLHGHLHRVSRTCLDGENGEVCEICANTALSDRERAGPAGYNILDVEARNWTLTVMAWRDGIYAPQDLDEPLG